MAKKKITKNPSRSSRASVSEPVVERSADTSNKKPALKRFAVPVLVLVILGLLYAFRGTFIAATVNGQPIGRMTVMKDLEKQYGKRALESIVTKTIIIQEAKKKNVTVSDKDIDNQIKTIEKNISAQGMTLDQALEAQGMTRQGLRDDLKVQLMVQKLVGGNVQVTDAEIKEYMDSNAEAFAENPEQAPKEADVREQLKQQKLQQKTQEYVAEIRKKAKVAYYTSY